MVRDAYLLKSLVNDDENDEDDDYDVVDVVVDIAVGGVCVNFHSDA